MAGSPKHKLEHEQEESAEIDTREVSLKDGRKLVVTEGQLVEIRNESGMVEIRIQLTEQGPVLQVEAARMQLKASESVQIESKKIELKSEEGTEIESEGDVRVRGNELSFRFRDIGTPRQQLRRNSGGYRRNSQICQAPVRNHERLRQSTGEQRQCVGTLL